MIIRSVLQEDASSICCIYNPFIDSTITFEEEPVSVEEMKNRIRTLITQYPFLVLETEEGIMGYAYASTWRSRSAYRFTAETTIYLCEKARGRGYGEILYSALCKALTKEGFHQAIGAIAGENPASVALHKKMGFKHVGTFEQVGFKLNQWLPVHFYQKHL